MSQTKIVTKLFNYEEGICAEVGFYAGNAIAPYSVIIRDCDADEAVGGAVRFITEESAIDYAKRCIA